MRLVSEDKDANPTSEWVETYLLLRVEGGADPVSSVAKALRNSGWTVQQPGGGRLLLTADRAEASFVLVSFSSFMADDDVDSVVEKFRAAAGQGGDDLFVADLMPYH